MLVSAGFTAKFGLVFVLTLENAFFRVFRANRNSIVLLKNGTTDFQINPPFERLGCFYVTISGSFELFRYCDFEAIFLENENLFRLKKHHFHTKLPHQKPMLRQIEWWVKNGPIKKNGVLPVTTLFFWKLYFILRTSYNELTWCTNDPNAYIRTFGKPWIFIWRCFFPVSILNRTLE